MINRVLLGIILNKFKIGDTVEFLGEGNLEDWKGVTGKVVIINERYVGLENLKGQPLNWPHTFCSIDPIHIKVIKHKRKLNIKLP